MADRFEVDTERLRNLAKNFEQDSQLAVGQAGGLRVNAVTASEMPGSREFAAAQVRAAVAFPQWATDYGGSARFAAQFARAVGRAIEDVEWHASEGVRREQIRGTVASALGSVPLKDNRQPPDAVATRAQSEAVL